MIKLSIINTILIVIFILLTSFQDLKSARQISEMLSIEFVDSIFNGTQHYLYLSDDELTKLGFQFGEDYRGYFHENFSDSSNYLFETTSKSSKAEIKGILKSISKSELPFYIYTATDLNDASEYSFEIINDTLVPVIFKRTNAIFNYNQTKIYWFTMHDGLFSLLPERYSGLKSKYEKIRSLKLSNPETNFIEFNNRPMDGVPFISFTKDELENLGFKFKSVDGNMKFDFHWNCNELIYHSDSIISNNNRKQDNYNSETLDSLKLKRSVSSDSCININYITDLNGSRLRKFQYTDKDFYRSHNNIKNALFPIKMEEYNTVFWLISTAAFFESLPKHLIRPVYIEWVNAVATDDISKSRFKSKGKYYDNGSSTYEFEEIELTPKPKENKLNVKFISNDNIQMSISLLNVNGFEIQQLQSKVNIASGTFEKEYDISEILSGIYIVYFETDKGYNNQRIVISR
jgi:hypothetical protein